MWCQSWRATESWRAWCPLECLLLRCKLHFLRQRTQCNTGERDAASGHRVGLLDSDNKDINFPDKLCDSIAEITDKFSFAYMQEAFIASLLAIASHGGKEAEDIARRWAGPQDPMQSVDLQTHMTGGGGEDPDMKHLVLWVEMQRQVKILRDEMEGEKLSERMEARFPSNSASAERRNEVSASGQSVAAPLELLKKYRDQLEATQQRHMIDQAELLSDATKRYM